MTCNRPYEHLTRLSMVISLMDMDESTVMDGLGMIRDGFVGGRLANGGSGTARTSPRS
jgi:hypothetical protein